MSQPTIKVKTKRWTDEIMLTQASGEEVVVVVMVVVQQWQLQTLRLDKQK